MSTTITIPQSPGGTDAMPNRRDVDSFYHLSGCSLAGKACRGTACFVARHCNPQRWARATNQEPRVYCLGQCFAAPSIYDDHAGARPHMEVRSRDGVVLGRLTSGEVRGLHAYIAQGGCRVLGEALTKSRERIIEMIEVSGLRGRGGAGFPTGRKWRAVAQQPGNEKFVIVNADEGDPGAYIDRFLLEDNPHGLIEGMLLAGYRARCRTHAL